jgi:hypothetical protein
MSIYKLTNRGIQLPYKLWMTTGLLGQNDNCGPLFAVSEQSAAWNNSERTRKPALRGSLDFCQSLLHHLTDSRGSLPNSSRGIYYQILNQHESRGMIIMTTMTTRCLGYWDEILTIATLKATTTKKNENSTDKEAVEKLKSENMMDFVELGEDDEWFHPIN